MSCKGGDERKRKSSEENNDSESVSTSAVNIEISDIFGISGATKHLSPVAHKIVDAVSSALHIVSEPTAAYLSERAASAGRRHEVLADAKALGRIEELSAGDLELRKRLRSRLIATEVRRQENIESATILAVEMAQNSESEASDTEIDPDFILEWMEGVKDVSSQELREAWAKILVQAASANNGRVPKPEIDLLKQFDSSIVKMLDLYVRIFVSAGHPCTGISEYLPAKFSYIDFELLEGLNVVKSVIPKELLINNIGMIAVQQTSRFEIRMLPEVYVWAPRKRVVELLKKLYPSDPIPDAEEVRLHLEANLRSILSNMGHNHVIKLGHNGDYVDKYRLTRGVASSGGGSDSMSDISKIEETISEIKSESILSASAKEVLIDLAKEGRVSVLISE